MRRASLILVWLSLVACAGSPKPSTPKFSVVDDAGRTVGFAAPARRVVSLAPSSTELLFAVGAGSQVVGRTTWCRYPAAALSGPGGGDGREPKMEAGAATRPEPVVRYASRSNR